MRYALGVAAGLASGLIFAFSSVIQKKAVNGAEQSAPLMRQLLRSPTWISAIAASFVAAPLNMAAYVALGPTLPPALAATGLAAIPLMGRFLLGERPGRRGYCGAASVALGGAAMGVTGFQISPEAVAWTDPAFLAKGALALCVLGACLASSLIAGSRMAAASATSAAGTAVALAAGFAQAVNNLLMAPLAGQLALFLGRGFELRSMAVIAASSLLLAAVNVGGIWISQLALKYGEVGRIAPLQQVPIQTIPLVLHVALFGNVLAWPRQVLLSACGLCCLLLGASCLGASNSKRVA